MRARATGTIHNISADAASLLLLREADCINPLINLLCDKSIEVCQAAAGTLQNMSREVHSRRLILAGDAIEPLTDLLLGSDMMCQVIIGVVVSLMIS